LPHSPEEKKRALDRVRRLRGQVEGLERALESGADCEPVLQQISAIRGAVHGLMAQVLEAHLRENLGPGTPDNAERARLVEALADILRTYVR
jgi:DNA-binding FrmR family transcriptional regulator